MSPLAGLRVDGERRWYTIDAADWRPMMIGDTPLQGFSWIPLASDEAGAWHSYWMRLEAGARSLQHRHEGTELIMVLEGVFTDDDGADFLPGQTVAYPAGSCHSTYSARGCTVLVVEGRASSVVAR
jgi:anti-sigma factor ChrR (cupin superfamily)